MTGSLDRDAIGEMDAVIIVTLVHGSQNKISIVMSMICGLLILVCDCVFGFFSRHNISVNILHHNWLFHNYVVYVFL